MSIAGYFARFSNKAQDGIVLIPERQTIYSPYAKEIAKARKAAIAKQQSMTGGKEFVWNYMPPLDLTDGLRKAGISDMKAIEMAQNIYTTKYAQEYAVNGRKLAMAMHPEENIKLFLEQYFASEQYLIDKWWQNIASYKASMPLKPDAEIVEAALNAARAEYNMIKSDINKNFPGYMELLLNDNSNVLKLFSLENKELQDIVKNSKTDLFPTS